jgi:hypothetical protein
VAWKRVSRRPVWDGISSADTKCPKSAIDRHESGAAFTVAFLDGENRSNVAASGHDADRKPATEAVCLANEVAKAPSHCVLPARLHWQCITEASKGEQGGAAAGRDMANLPCFTSTPSLDFSFPPANIGQILRVSIFPKNTSGRDCRTGCYAFAHIRRAGETLVVWPRMPIHVGGLPRLGLTGLHTLLTRLRGVSNHEIAQLFRVWAQVKTFFGSQATLADDRQG